MRYLIDGYNLLHAIGLARKSGGRASWDRARATLLDWLADRHGTTAADATVVFDAQNAAAGVTDERHRGLRVLRHGGRTADDVIEDLVRAEQAPRSLTVVSNDHRVREAANRRGAAVRRCAEYVDYLVGVRQELIVEDVGISEKEISATDEDRAEWLRAFGGEDA